MSSWPENPAGMFSPLLCKNLHRAQRNIQTRLSQHRIWTCLWYSFSNSAAGTNMAARCLWAPSTCSPTPSPPLACSPLVCLLSHRGGRICDIWKCSGGGRGRDPDLSSPPPTPYLIIRCLRAPTSNALQIRSRAAARRRLRCCRGLKRCREGFPSGHTHDRCGEKTHTGQIGVLVREQRGNVNRPGLTVSHQLTWQKHAEHRNQQFWCWFLFFHYGNEKKNNFN